MQAFLEIHQQAHEGFLERTAERFGFSLRPDLIFFDDFAGTKTYLLEGEAKRYAGLQASAEKLGCKISRRTTEGLLENFAVFLSDCYNW